MTNITTKPEAEPREEVVELLVHIALTGSLSTRDSGIDGDSLHDNVATAVKELKQYLPVTEMEIETANSEMKSHIDTLRQYGIRAEVEAISGHNISKPCE